MMMDGTDEDLKDKVGSRRTSWRPGRRWAGLPVRMTVQLDNNRPVRRHAMLCVIGNVGALRATSP